MRVNEIKELLRRKSVTFDTGEIKPTKALLESWIGRVGFKLTNEVLPTDDEGEELMPLAMLFLKDLPYLPEPLKDLSLISIFMSEYIFDELGDIDDISSCFVVRKYKTLNNLIPCDWNSSDMIIPFPLSPTLREDDFPMWDGGGIPFDIEEEICKMKDEGELDYFDDIREGIYSEHKIGGYPAFCQSGIETSFDGYEFVIQISTDAKANFNIVDSGSFYFYYNKKNDDWKVHCDFY